MGDPLYDGVESPGMRVGGAERRGLAGTRRGLAGTRRGLAGTHTGTLTAASTHLWQAEGEHRGMVPRVLKDLFAVLAALSAAGEVEAGDCQAVRDWYLVRLQ